MLCGRPGVSLKSMPLFRSDKRFLNRISLNMLRHEFTDYEYIIAKMFGKIGRIEGCSILRERVDSLILQKYPFLREQDF